MIAMMTTTTKALQMHLIMQNNIAPRIFFLIKRDLLANITRNEK